MCVSCCHLCLHNRKLVHHPGIYNELLLLEVQKFMVVIRLFAVCVIVVTGILLQINILRSGEMRGWYRSSLKAGRSDPKTPWYMFGSISSG